MVSKENNNYHLVDMSPWPILTSFSLLALTVSIVMIMHEYNGRIVVGIISCSMLVYCIWNWWRDVISEGLQGHHCRPVRQGLKIGMFLFIISEIMLFFALFFAYFSASLFPAGILDGLWTVGDGVWPPADIKVFDPWSIPFLNTLILLLSGTTVTWAHYAIKDYNQKDAVTAIGLTILLGITFSLLQIYEYCHAAFGLTDGVYAANFYLTTGFHGAHVIIGTIFLIVCFFRAKKGHFNAGRHHLGFEFAAWYWHFVDIIWIFLFLTIYVFGR